MADIKEKEIVEDENKIDTVIADDIHFRGSLKFKNSLKIKGIFEGKIETDGHLIVGREATVSADINARIVSVSGIVNGKIRASQKVELFKKSRSGCDMIAPDLSIESGSVFNGTIIMEEKQ
ncbi:MAG: cell division protein [Spirochaetae bacterium HGW-Spirochaetae-1]|jgi:cytoskeletal protein CcmA (bactofilin family)|nr:MAG: cell division protein [Spirochaetae bacterium HGW-Spirochaetae-1]